MSTCTLKRGGGGKRRNAKSGARAPKSTRKRSRGGRQTGRGGAPPIPSMPTLLPDAKIRRDYRAYLIRQGKTEAQAQAASDELKQLKGEAAKKKYAEIKSMLDATTAPGTTTAPVPPAAPGTPTAPGTKTAPGNIGSANATFTNMLATPKGTQVLRLVQELLEFGRAPGQRSGAKVGANAGPYNTQNPEVTQELGFRAGLRAACLLALANPNDPRFANAGIPISDACIVAAGGIISPDGTVGAKNGKATYARARPGQKCPNISGNLSQSSPAGSSAADTAASPTGGPTTPTPAAPPGSSPADTAVSPTGGPTASTSAAPPVSSAADTAGSPTAGPTASTSAAPPGSSAADTAGSPTGGPSTKTPDSSAADTPANPAGGPATSTPDSSTAGTPPDPTAGPSPVAPGSSATPDPTADSSVPPAPV